MEMNAMESFKDPHMVYLDVVAGISGLVLTMMLLNGYKNTRIPLVLVPLMLFVLISRLLVDLYYYYFVSRTLNFGGSNMEFILSSIIWFVLSFIYLNATKNKYDGHIPLALLYFSSVGCMMAIARLTHWG